VPLSAFAVLTALTAARMLLLLMLLVLGELLSPLALMY
jgi:hypothetical protein